MNDMKRLTFAQFQATGTPSQDLRKDVPDDFRQDDYPEAVPGRLYAGDFALYLQTDTEAPEGTHFTEAGGGGLTGTLEACEEYLYGFYITECADREIRAELLAQAPAGTREHWSP